MRLSNREKEVIHTAALEAFGAEARVRLFGSRLDDAARGALFRADSTQKRAAEDRCAGGVAGRPALGGAPSGASIQCQQAAWVPHQPHAGHRPEREYGRGRDVLDNLAVAERLGWVDNAVEWLTARELRNRG